MSFFIPLIRANVPVEEPLFSLVIASDMFFPNLPALTLAPNDGDIALRISIPLEGSIMYSLNPTASDTPVVMAVASRKAPALSSVSVRFIKEFPFINLALRTFLIISLFFSVTILSI